MYSLSTGKNDQIILSCTFLGVYVQSYTFSFFGGTPNSEGEALIELTQIREEKRVYILIICVNFYIQMTKINYNIK